MNGASTPNVQAGATLGGAGIGTLNPVKNPKSVRISQLNSGFLIESQNVDTYGSVNDVAMDLDGAVKIASDYFAQ